jgi:methyl-accepting chemotaxis protein-1 (serine sensor receptor)
MFKRTRIRTLLTAALVLLATLLTGVGVSGLLDIRTANDAHENTYQNIPTLIAIARQQQGLAGARMALDRAVADPSGPDADAALAAAQALIAESDRQWKAYKDFPSEDEEKRIAAKVEASRNALKASAIEPVMTALRSQDKAAATHFGA